MFVCFEIEHDSIFSKQILHNNELILNLVQENISDLQIQSQT